MIKLETYNKDHYDALSYDLDLDQADYTSSIEYCVNEKKIAKENTKSIITILYQDQPVGFFVLDNGEDKLALTKNPFSVLLRSFSINPKYQDQGLGTEAMTAVSNYIQENIPNVTEIILAVNSKNQKAYQVYLKSGYVDKKITMVGKKGILNILSKELPMEVGTSQADT